jgi:uncharacterized damage-inducible protein DinB
MNKAEILTLYDYNYWATGRILQAAAPLSPEQFSAPAPVSFGSLRGTLVHAFSTERIWRQRCQEGLSPTALLSEAEFPTLADLSQRWSEEESAMHTYLDGLDEQALAAWIRYTSTRGVSYETPLWQILMHVVNHGTQFRSEAGVILSSLGHSPGDVDLIFYLRR